MVKLPDTEKKPPSKRSPPPSDTYAGRAAAKAVITRRLSDLSDDQLIDAFKADPRYILRQVRWLTLKDNQQKYRLRLLINKNPSLKPILERTLARLPPPVQPRPKPEAKPEAAPPKVTAEQFFEGEPKPRQDINWKNAPEIEAWLNNLKPEFYKYLSQGDSVEQAAKSSQIFTQRLWSFLSLYRGQIAGHYLHEGALELLYSALGPIGNMMSYVHLQNYTWKIAWQKNLLNPNALNYYLQSMPVQKAFSLLQYPIKGTFAILAHGGAPLISKIYVREQRFDPRRGWVEDIKQKHVFTPLLRATQTSHTIADKLDKFADIEHDNKKINKQFKKALETKDASKLREALYKFDGPTASKALFKKSFSNTARRLRNTHKDPISFLAILIAGTLFDFTVGLALSTLRLAAIRTIANIPALASLRGRFIEFLSSNRWLSTASIAKSTSSAFFRGLLSPATVSGTYLGYQFVGPSLADFIGNLTGNPALAAAIKFPLQVTISATAGTLSALYNISAQLASNPNTINWVRNYQLYSQALQSQSLARFGAQKALQKSFINQGRAILRYTGENKLLKAIFGDIEALSFRPGPLTRFANFLNQKWLLRAPLNGLALRTFLLNALPSNILSSQIFGIPIEAIVKALPYADYFWQIKGNLYKNLSRVLGKSSWKIFGRTVTNPHWRYLSFKNPNAFLPITLRRFWLRSAYGEAVALGVYAEKPWFQKFNNIINNITKAFKAVKPWLKNFINPGFFFGITILGPYLSGLGLHPLFAYPIGMIAGSLSWNAIAFIAEKLWGAKGISMAKINALGWTGFLVGSVLQLIFPSLPSWFAYALSLTLPAINALLSIFGVNLTTILANAIAPLYAAITGIPLAASLAGLTTVLSALSLIGFTVFAGFMVFSAFWVPLQETLQAGPQSACFNLQTTMPQTINDGPCSTLKITTDLLLDKNHLIHAILIYGYEFDMNHPEDLYESVTRKLPDQSNPLELTFIDSVANLTNRHYSSSISPDYTGYPWLTTYLSTITSFPQTFFNLQQTYPQYQGLQKISTFYLDLTKQILEDQNNQQQDTLEKYQAQKNILKKQIEEFENIVNDFQSLSKENDLEDIKKDLQSILNDLDQITTTNPFQKNIDDYTNNCSLQPSTCQEIIRIYQSWNSFFNIYQESTESLLSTANQLDSNSSTFSTDFDNLLTSIDSEYQEANDYLENLNQQYQSLDIIVDQINDIDFSSDWFNLLQTINYQNFTSLDEDTLSNLQNILKQYFEDIFGNNKKYYFIPSGTVYKICTKKLEPKFTPDPSSPAGYTSIVYGLQSALSTPYCTAVSHTAPTTP